MSDTILMIHGMSGGGWCWENFKKFFTKNNYNCITPTLRYHDAELQEPSHKNLGTTSLLDYVEDLEKRILQSKSSPILIGHSMGGLIAQKLCSNISVKAVVLLAPAPPYGIFTLNFSMIKAFKSVLGWNFWRKPIRQNYEEAVYSALHLLPEEERKKIYKKSVYESGKVIFEMGCWFLDFKKATKVEETKINAPMVIISGSKDRIIPPSLAKKIYKKYQSISEYKEFPQHAHWLLGEPTWRKVAEYIEKWINKKVK